MSAPTLEIDFAYALDDNLDPLAASAGGFEAARERFPELITSVLQAIEDDDLGFWSLPDDAELIETIQAETPPR